MGFTTTYSRQKSDAEKRADAREKVAARARNGYFPRDEHSEEDLAWAFAPPHAEELDELERVAEEARERRQARAARAVHGRAIKLKAQSILKEWEEVRWQAALAEARRRLGVEEDA
jgi:hypothetical protein